MVNFSGLRIIEGRLKSAKVVASTRRNYSSNFLVDPLDYRWMKTYSSNMNILITVNNITAICKNNCTYQFLNQIPVLKNVSLIENILLI